MKKLVCSILILVFCLCGMGCRGYEGLFNRCGVGLRLYESEYFIYTVGYDSNNITILGLTNKGRQQEYLIIPEMLDDKKVTYVNTNGISKRKITLRYGEKCVGLQSDCLKKVFIIPGIKVGNEEFFKLAKKLEAVLYISNAARLQNNLNDYNYYYTEYNAISLTRSANVSYYHNYEASPNNGYYWIDNCKYGERIEYIPPQPKRDGYTFGGWYKESECINVWSYETDTLPEVKYYDNAPDIEEYQETKLFAKWIKK